MESSQVSCSDIEQMLPFKLKSISTDNGNEFLNHLFVKYMQDRDEKIPLKRGRPYRKNDQCYVEQKNFTHAPKNHLAGAIRKKRTDRNYE